MSAPGIWNRAVRVLLVVQAVLFAAVAHSEAPQAWTVLSSYFGEIAADLLGEGGHPLDGYDGLVFGPLFYGALEAPLLALMGRVGAVHTTATLLIALAATALTYRFVARVASPRAGFLAALLVALPPPNTWVHQHFGAYHVLPLALVPAAGLLLFAPDEDRAPGRRWFGGGLLVGASVGASLGSISLGPPLLLARLLQIARRSGAGAAAKRGASASLGGLLGLSPMLYKALVHAPWAGLAPTDGSAAKAVKPLFLGGASFLELLTRPVTMLARDLPYGLHFEMEGMAAAGWVWAGTAYAAVLVVVVVAWRRRDALPEWTPLLAVPAAVVVVGTLTGWFVFHPGDGDGWTRDARHIVGLTLALAWLMGIAASELEGTPGRRAVVLLVALAAASASTQVVAVARAGGPLHAATPWRLEGRFVSGFFRGPAFAGAPEAAARSCEVLREDRRPGCLRGVALAFGHATAGTHATGGRVGPLLADRAARLGTDTTPLLHGLGWAHAQGAFGTPERVTGRCRRDPSLDAAAQERCIEGVGWGYAMDFADRPAVARAALDRVDVADRVAFARGVGVLVRDLIADEGARDRRCRALTTGLLAAACRDGAGLSDAP